MTQDQPTPGVITVGMVAQALRCHEQAARGLLQEVDKTIDRYATNPGEPVKRETVIDLWAIRAGDSVGRHLTPLLEATMP